MQRIVNRDRIARIPFNASFSERSRAYLSLWNVLVCEWAFYRVYRCRIWARRAHNGRVIVLAVFALFHNCIVNGSVTPCGETVFVAEKHRVCAVTEGSSARGKRG